MSHRLRRRRRVARAVVRWRELRLRARRELAWAQRDFRDLKLELCRYARPAKRRLERRGGG